MHDNEKKLLAAEEYRAEAAMHRKLIRNAWISFLKTGLFVVTATISAVIITVAWYANNSTSSTNGMSTNVSVSSNLIVSKENDLSALDLSENHFQVVFDDKVQNLTPARHHDGIKYPVGLEYNSNPKDVSSASGVQLEGKTLLFEPVPEYVDDVPKRYYYDYTVYISATSEAIDASNLIATMDLSSDHLEDYMNALTVDFYVDDEYKGTLNRAGVSWENDRSTLDAVELAEDSGIMIPLYTEAGKNSIKVLMRCYFDGGLEKTANQTYVYSDGINTGDYQLSINIKAVDK